MEFSRVEKHRAAGSAVVFLWVYKVYKQTPKCHEVPMYAKQLLAKERRAWSQDFLPQKLARVLGALARTSAHQRRLPSKLLFSSFDLKFLWPSFLRLAVKKTAHHSQIHPEILAVCHTWPG